MAQRDYVIANVGLAHGDSRNLILRSGSKANERFAGGQLSFVEFGGVPIPTYRAGRMSVWLATVPVGHEQPVTGNPQSSNRLCKQAHISRTGFSP